MESAPTDLIVTFKLTPVGEDIILPPFIKVSLRITRAVGGLAAARSRSRSDNTPCCHSLRSRRYATPAPTGLIVALIFVCRKGLSPHALPNAMLQGRLDYGSHLIIWRYLY